MCIDMPAECLAAIRNSGFRVAEGRFGPRRRRDAGKSDVLLELGASLPNLAEQEVIVMNLGPVHRDPFSGISVAPGDTGIWEVTEQRFADTRPYEMAMYNPILQRAVGLGAVIIAVAAPERLHTYNVGVAAYHRGPNADCEEAILSTWTWIHNHQHIQTHSIDGTEIKWTDHALAKLIAPLADKASYSCSFEYTGPTKSFVPLALSKHNEVVAALILGENEEPRCILLPHVPSLGGVVAVIIDQWLSDVCQRLFDDVEKTKWHEKPPYENEEVLSHVASTKTIQEKHEELMQLRRDETRRLRERFKDEYDLMIGTGEDLHLAVIRTFRAIGFSKVENCDEMASSSEFSSSLKQDILVRDRNTVLVVDVKGLKGCPTDSDCQQSNKHAGMLNRADKASVYQGLMILNAQRDVPPRDRNPNPIRPEMLADAVENKYGHLSSWDLLSILRNSRKLGWPTSATLDIFYRTGRIDPVPSHYLPVGVVEHRWKDAFRLVPAIDLSRGQRLAVQINETFEEVNAMLQVNGVDVRRVTAGTRCGVAFAECSDRLRVGDRVFVVRVGTEHG
jgi:hypothetical protein